MQFTTAQLLYAILLITCVISVLSLRMSHQADIEDLAERSRIAAIENQRLTEAKMLARVMREKASLKESDYWEIAHSITIMAIDSGRDVGSWDREDYARADAAGELLKFFGITNTKQFIKLADASPELKITSSIWQEDSNFIEWAVSSASDSTHVVDSDKVWKAKSD